MALLDSAGIRRALVLSVAYLYGSPARTVDSEYAKVRAEKRHHGLGPVAERILYREAMLETNTYWDINRVIEEFRQSCRTIRPRIEIPL